MRNWYFGLSPALKRATYLIPTLAIPEVVSLATGNERPIINSVIQAVIIYGMVKVVSHPFTKRLDSELEFAV